MTNNQMAAFIDFLRVAVIQNVQADLYSGMRMLLKNRGFTILSVLTFSFAVSSSTAVFSLVNTVLLKPLPYQESNNLVTLYENNVQQGWRRLPVSPAVFADWSDQADIFESLSVRGWGAFILTGDPIPEYVEGAYISVNTFQMLGLRPIIGRDFLAEEGSSDNNRVALIGSELWKRRYGQDPGIVGRNITVNGEMHTVVGVMPPGIFFPEPHSQIWVPQVFSPDEFQDRHRHMYSIYGRLKQGVTLEKARSQLDQIAKRRADLDPQNKEWGVEIHLLKDVVLGDSGTPLAILSVTVGMLLILGCTNVAGLLLVQSAARAGEFAIRQALGASRGSLIRQLLTESLLLSLFSGAAGIGMSHVMLHLIQKLTPPNLPRFWEGIHLDGTALAFAVLVTFAGATISGITPFLPIKSRNLVIGLTGNTLGANSIPIKHGLRTSLVICQIALAMLLLTGGGLMIQSLQRLFSQSLGYKPEQITALTIGRPDNKGDTLQARMQFFDQLLTQVQALPGFESAALVRGLPIREKGMISVRVQGGALPAAKQEIPSAGYAQVSPGYFRTMGIELLQGRDFTNADSTNSRPVIIVDETFVRNFRIADAPLGKLVQVADAKENLEIIGVVNDIKRTSLADAPRGEVYRTFLQSCPHQMHLLLNSKLPTTEIARRIRIAMDQIDKDQPIGNITTLTHLIDSSVSHQRWVMYLLNVSSVLALLLAAVGLYGLLAYSVMQRRQEIGIRLALGAQRKAIIELIINQAMKITFLGIGIGLACALAFTRFLESLLFGIEPTDPATLTAVAALILLVSLIASFVPVRRATQVSPAVLTKYPS